MNTPLNKVHNKRIQSSIIKHLEKYGTLQVILPDNNVLEIGILEEDEIVDDWSVYILNTKTHVAVVAAKGEVGSMIPEDGSFISGALVGQNLSEEGAKELIERIGKCFGNSGWEEENKGKPS